MIEKNIKIEAHVMILNIISTRSEKTEADLGSQKLPFLIKDSFTSFIENSKKHG